MNVFIIGLPQSGKSFIAQSICNDNNKFQHIDVGSWIKDSFRTKLQSETDRAYQDAFYNYISIRLKLTPDLFYSYIKGSILDFSKNYIIEGVNSPHLITQLFDYNKDFIIFLNKIDNDSEFPESENIGVSNIRDYCYWLSSLNLIDKEKWLEFNYKLSDQDLGFSKYLGCKNTVVITKSIEKISSILKEKLCI